jgi:integrase
LPVFPRLTFADVAAKWFARLQASVRSGERRERTLENYRYQLNGHLLPTLGRRHMQPITTEQIAELIAALQSRGLAPKTVAGALVPLGSILRFALRRGYIVEDPMRKLERCDRPRIPRRRQCVLDREELGRLLAAAPPRHRTMLATAAYTGLRISELLGLT